MDDEGWAARLQRLTKEMQRVRESSLSSRGRQSKHSVLDLEGESSRARPSVVTATSPAASSDSRRTPRKLDESLGVVRVSGDAMGEADVAMMPCGVPETYEAKVRRVGQQVRSTTENLLSTKQQKRILVVEDAPSGRGTRRKTQH